MRLSAIAVAVLLGGSVAASWATDVPRPATPLIVPAPGGGIIDLAKYRGKLVVVEFLSVGCQHCQKTSAMMEKLYRELGPRGFQPLGIAMDEGAANLVPNFTKAFGLTYPVGVGQWPTYFSFLNIPPMTRPSVPQLVFIDRSGTVRGQFEGEMEEKEMRTRIEALLSAGPARPAAPAKAN